MDEMGEGEDCINPQRPLYGIQIYDTTPDARDPEHVRRIALTLHRLTFHYSGGTPPGFMSRTTDIHHYSQVDAVTGSRVRI